MPDKREGFPKREFHKVSFEGNAICKNCHAVHMNKRWFFSKEDYEKLRKENGINVVLCPGCQRVKDKYIDGVINIKSYLVDGKKQELISLIRHEEKLELEKNPLSRIVDIETKKGFMSIQTTTEFLATRIGHALDKSHKGKLEIQKLPREKFVRVNWTKEEAEGEI